MTHETPTYLLRLEGVNISAVLDDTNEVSIRRGAGLMLRQAVKDIDATFKQLSPISLGASAGLFEFRSAESEKLTGQVAAQLEQDYPHLTFVVDAVPVDGDFPKARERITARNRFRQYRQPTLVPPRSVPSADCCPTDRMRPAVPKTNEDNIKGKQASRSAIDRFQYGREKRQDFYTQELGKPVRDAFTDDLEQLTEPGDLQGLGNLSYKMAVIYLDGNRFGKIQRGCTTAADLTEFDQTIQGDRREFLRTLLERAHDDPGFRNMKQLRLETLLWGGDEILVVVPAWRGMQTLQWFFEASRTWRFRDNRLTHAAGLVFCHHKTPLAQVVKTAKALAEGVKERDREHNGFDYLVLESIDYPTQPLQAFRALRYWPNVEDDLLPLAPFTESDPEAAASGQDAADWDSVAKHQDACLDGLPRGAVLDVAQALVDYRRARADSLADRLIEQARARFHERVERLLAVGVRDDLTGESLKGATLRAKLHRLFFERFGIRAEDDDHPGWLHLIELWDYLAPSVHQHEGGGQ